MATEVTMEERVKAIETLVKKLAVDMIKISRRQDGLDSMLSTRKGPKQPKSGKTESESSTDL